jgi:hypothetical protein
MHWRHQFHEQQRPKEVLVEEKKRTLGYTPSLTINAHRTFLAENCVNPPTFMTSGIVDIDRRKDPRAWRSVELNETASMMRVDKLGVRKWGNFRKVKLVAKSRGCEKRCLYVNKARDASASVFFLVVFVMR